MKKMLFIYNPNAGTGTLKPKLSDILDVFTKAGYEVTVYPTQKSHDGAEKMLSCPEGYDLIVCSGGDGTLDEVCSPYPIDEKFRAFGFDAVIIDGHDFDAIEEAFAHAREVKGKPCVIIAKTVKGKGVSFMENQVGWHGTAPNQEQYEVAMQDLKQALAALEVE